jgi:hypothetical protein
MSNPSLALLRSPQREDLLSPITFAADLPSMMSADAVSSRLSDASTPSSLPSPGRPRTVAVPRLRLDGLSGSRPSPIKQLRPLPAPPGAAIAASQRPSWASSSPDGGGAGRTGFQLREDGGARSSEGALARPRAVKQLAPVTLSAAAAPQAARATLGQTGPSRSPFRTVLFPYDNAAAAGVPSPIVSGARSSAEPSPLRPPAPRRSDARPFPHSSPARKWVGPE